MTGFTFEWCYPISASKWDSKCAAVCANGAVYRTIRVPPGYVGPARIEIPDILPRSLVVVRLYKTRNGVDFLQREVVFTPDQLTSRGVSVDRNSLRIEGPPVLSEGPAPTFYEDAKADVETFTASIKSILDRYNGADSEFGIFSDAAKPFSGVLVPINFAVDSQMISPRAPLGRNVSAWFADALAIATHHVSGYMDRSSPRYMAEILRDVLLFWVHMHAYIPDSAVSGESDSWSIMMDQYSPDAVAYDCEDGALHALRTFSALCSLTGLNGMAGGACALTELVAYARKFTPLFTIATLHAVNGQSTYHACLMLVRTDVFYECVDYNASLAAATRKFGSPADAIIHLETTQMMEATYTSETASPDETATCEDVMNAVGIASADPTCTDVPVACCPYSMAAAWHSVRYLYCAFVPNRKGVFIYGNPTESRMGIPYDDVMAGTSHDTIFLAPNTDEPKLAEDTVSLLRTLLPPPTGQTVVPQATEECQNFGGWPKGVRRPIFRRVSPTTDHWTLALTATGMTVDVYGSANPSALTVTGQRVEGRMGRHVAVTADSWVKLVGSRTDQFDVRPRDGLRRSDVVVNSKWAPIPRIWMVNGDPDDIAANHGAIVARHLCFVREKQSSKDEMDTTIRRYEGKQAQEMFIHTISVYARAATTRHSRRVIPPLLAAWTEIYPNGHVIGFTITRSTRNETPFLPVLHSVAKGSINASDVRLPNAIVGFITGAIEAGIAPAMIDVARDFFYLKAGCIQVDDAGCFELLATDIDDESIVDLQMSTTDRMTKIVAGIIRHDHSKKAQTHAQH